MANNNDKKILNVPNLRFPEFSGEWKECCIRDFGTVITGNTPPTKNEEYYSNGIKLWASPADLGKDKYVIDTNTKLSQSGFERTRILPTGSVLVTCIGSTIGKMGMAKYEMSINQQINSVVVDAFTDRNFAYYAIQNAFPRYLSEVAVQAVPILSKSNFEKLPNYKPTLQEQKKLGAFIDLLDQRISTQNKIIEDLKSLIKGLEERLLRTGTDNYSLNKLCSIQSGYSGMQEILPQGLKVSRIETISQGVVNMDKVGYVKPFGNAETYKLHIGNILFSNINSVPYIGNLAYIEDDYELYHGMNLLRLIPNTDYILPKYLFYCLRDIKMKSYFQRICNKAVSQASINQTDLGKVEICIPCKERQSKIVDSIDSLEQKLTQNIHLKDLFHSQKTALLQQMFI